MNEKAIVLAFARYKERAEHKFPTACALVEKLKMWDLLENAFCAVLIVGRSDSMKTISLLLDEDEDNDEA